ncbi:hypothetical protein [Moorena sp. SIO2C4]|uniref:hypothetical protein n=1 Tax=Moorena sp. SIO2C4 TaxID=2607824 RepID=UPI0013C5E569|nr:hypothetical protein [Moorena sp. SIO2C4]NES45677.1 hypothetical protein [Moorena sp. SIO2C4]
MSNYSTISVLCLKLASATLLCLLSPSLAPENLGVAPAVAQTTPDQAGEFVEQFHTLSREEGYQYQLPVKGAPHLNPQG